MATKEHALWLCICYSRGITKNIIHVKFKKIQMNTNKINNVRNINISH